MSVLMKYFVGLLAIFCVMQFVEMARLRRDDAATAGNSGGVATEFADTVNKIVDGFKEKMQSEDFKNLMNSINTAISEGTKTLQDEFSKLASNLNANKAPAGR